MNDLNMLATTAHTSLSFGLAGPAEFAAFGVASAFSLGRFLVAIPALLQAKAGLGSLGVGGLVLFGEAALWLGWAAFILTAIVVLLALLFRSRVLVLSSVFLVILIAWFAGTSCLTHLPVSNSDDWEDHCADDTLRHLEQVFHQHGIVWALGVAVMAALVVAAAVRAYPKSGE
jgi:hypothetical protein